MDQMIHQTAQTLHLKDQQVSAVLDLLKEGATVPFIARYRKERTGGLNEDQIREINSVYEYSVHLQQRKEDVIRLIEEKGMMTAELKNQILKADQLSVVEDYYRPYKEKKKTRATVAKAAGLQPLADFIMTYPRYGSVEGFAQDYVKDDLTLEQAIQGAQDIIAESIADNAKFRQHVKRQMFSGGMINTSLKRNAEDEKQIYEMYYDHSERVKFIPDHRVLAINRGEKEKVLNVSVSVDEDRLHDFILKGLIWNRSTCVKPFISDCVKDALKRLILPSIEREVRHDLTDKAEAASLVVFSRNLEKLLLQPPMKDRYVLGVDPAFRTGCKLAALDPTGKVLAIDKVYITIPKKDYTRDEHVLLSMIKDYHIELIAIGNGTASRETEAFIAKLIKRYGLPVQYTIVSEAGASVYSASAIAKEEFPDYQVEERSAVSIGRRLQDPLSELVKIEPKAISVGQYQHDMNQKRLGEQLDFVVEKVVNQVGVNINTASPSLLQYVSGLNSTTAKNIVNYREANGAYTNRNQIKKVPKLGPKSFEQSVGFLRILDGSNKLDETPIHPDNYQDALKLLDYVDMTIDAIGSDEMKKTLSMVDQTKVMKDLNMDHYLVEDLIDAFMSPHRSPRDEYDAPVLKSDILTIEDLKEGMMLEGVVRNVVDFGAFVDIGLKNDGLVHRSKLAAKKVNHPLDVVNVGDIVNVWVIGVDLAKKRVALSMIDPLV